METEYQKKLNAIAKRLNLIIFFRGAMLIFFMFTSLAIPFLLAIYLNRYAFCMIIFSAYAIYKLIKIFLNIKIHFICPKCKGKLMFTEDTMGANKCTYIQCKSCEIKSLIGDVSDAVI